jgi:hypothetical protein
MVNFHFLRTMAGIDDMSYGNVAVMGLVLEDIKCSRAVYVFGYLLLSQCVLKRAEMHPCTRRMKQVHEEG